MAKANRKARGGLGILEPWLVYANRGISKRKKNKSRGNN